MAENRININTAGRDELAKLPMVGDSRAQYLIDHRPYNNWEDLQKKVPSLSETMVNDLKKAGATVE